MRNIKLVLEYDGSDFLGWQYQPEGRTVQGVLSTALGELLQESPKLHGSGRTDSGVHALAQVANFKTTTALALAAIRNGLNANLPQDVRVLQVDEVEPEFHARYDAVSREYRFIISKRIRAVGRQYDWFCRYALDVGQMRKATDHLIGLHDFRAFSKKNMDEKHYLSRVERIDWQETEDRITMEICANRFLHNMIRIIIGTAVEVGRGKMSASEVRDILIRKERTNAGCTVPGHGLFLLRVNY